jgi:hypothetical protein
MMQETTVTFFKNLKKKHWVMLILHIVIPDMFVFLLNKISDNNDKFEALHKVMLWLMPVILIACIIAAAYMFKQKIDESINWQHNNLFDKLGAYKNACIVRWFMIDITIALSTVLFLLTQSCYYLIIAFIALVLIILYAPSKEQAIAYLQLNDKEQAVLQNEYSIL